MRLLPSLRRVAAASLLPASWLVVLCVAAYGAVAHLGYAPWATDEPVYRNAARAIFSFGNWSHNLEHPPLGKLAIGLSESIFGADAWATRLPSALFTLIGGAFLALLAARLVDRARGWVALVAFAAWTLLPHPLPDFDINRLAYLDAGMCAAIAAVLYCGWRWQEHFAWRWAVACGFSVGIACAFKLPAMFLPVPLLALMVSRSDAPAVLRAKQFVVAVIVATMTAFLPWLPLGENLPRSLRFLAAMQARDIDQTLTIAGTTFDSPPVWTQLWWQWDAWAPMALVQLIAVIAIWWAVPRRTALYLTLAWATPFAAYAIGNGRILPHWMATWQPAITVCIAIVGVRGVQHLLSANFSTLDTKAIAKHSVVGIGALSLIASSASYGVQRTQQIAAERPSIEMRAAEVLRTVDKKGVVIASRTALIPVHQLVAVAHVVPSTGLYHSAVEIQHPWFRGPKALVHENEDAYRSLRSFNSLEVDTAVFGGVGDTPFRKRYLAHGYEMFTIGGSRTGRVTIYLRKD